MKSRLTILSVLLLLAMCPASAWALDDSARLMQEYMVRRAELLGFRTAELAKIKEPKDEKEKAQKQEQLAKLEEDEKPLRKKVDEAARAYKGAIKAKKDQLPKPAAPGSRS